MRAHFFVPHSPKDVFAEFDPASSAVRAQYQVLANSFRHTISATLSTVSVPFQLAATSAEHSHYQRYYLAEMIRADPDVETTDEVLKVLQTNAGQRMQEFVGSEEGRNAVIRDTCEFLLRGLSGGLALAAQELLQQGLVLLWSGFEVFFRDTFELLVNDTPAHVQVLTTDPTTRKRFELQRLSMDTLGTLLRAMVSIYQRTWGQSSWDNKTLAIY